MSFRPTQETIAKSVRDPRPRIRQDANKHSRFAESASNTKNAAGNELTLKTRTDLLGREPTHVDSELVNRQHYCSKGSTNYEKGGRYLHGCVLAGCLTGDGGGGGGECAVVGVLYRVRGRVDER